MDSAPSKTTLRSVINQVTKEKLAVLDTQRQTLKTVFSPILEKYEKPENKSSLKFLEEIHLALKNCSIISEGDKANDLAVFFNSMNVSDKSNSLVCFGTDHLVQHWIDTLIKNIKFEIEKCEYSCLYANVMTQFMDMKTDDNEMEDVVVIESAEGESHTDKEKMVQEFSERIFTPSPDYNKEEFDNFLSTELFNFENPKQKELLTTIRNDMKQYCKNASRPNLGSEDIKLVINGLLAEDLLGAEKAVTLKELRENDDALNEVCTLLKNRIQNFKEWNWPGPVQVDFRRNMAGRYRAYMDEDIITAILLHYLGAMWSIRMKTTFKQIYSTKIWKRGTGTVGDLYYKKQSIEGFRREFHEKSFLSILPNRLADLAATGAIYDENESRSKSSSSCTTPMQVKQQLLHLISNEIHLNKVLRPEQPLVLAQTDIEWCGPSLIHDSIISLMRFFGVTEDWLNFFQKYLQTPLKVEGKVQIRKRGVPLSHSFSALFGEAILFVMDLYVNQVAGLSLYRIHDDFWFWSHNTETITTAWKAIQTFTKLAGLKLNEEKSASVICKPGAESTPIVHGPAPLPQNNVKWGFVVMHSDGVFRISQEILEPHVKEMRECLQKADTVMSWIHCHNRYIRFFIRNFAEPAQTFEKQHVVQIMQALQKILQEVHKEVAGNPVEALKTRFANMWEGKDVMDSWVHWPVQEGGLGLHNPFLDLIPLNEAYRKLESRRNQIQGVATADTRFGQVVDADKTRWEHVLEESKKRRKRRENEGIEEVMDEDGNVTDLETNEDDGDDGSDDESYRSKPKKNKKKKYTKRIGYSHWCERYRETMWGRWRNRYCELLKNIEPEDPSDDVDDCDNWRERMYGKQLHDKFGQSSFINTNLIPLSLISAMQTSRVHKN